jgi:hypothetical protein
MEPGTEISSGTAVSHADNPVRTTTAPTSDAFTYLERSCPRRRTAIAATPVPAMTTWVPIQRGSAMNPGETIHATARTIKTNKLSSRATAPTNPTALMAWRAVLALESQFVRA